MTESDNDRAAWRDRRPAARGPYFNSAGAGRSSLATLRAVAAHAELEAEVGGYAAEAEARPVLERGRAELAGLLGAEADGLAFAESATAAVGALLAAWPLEHGDTVAVVPGEWGPNLAAFGNKGLRIAELPVRPDGVLDLEGLRRFVAAMPPAFVHLCQVASHRPLVQPVAAALSICREAGVPLWVDAAQALGHADTAYGADATYATSRKWLAGPRGVGVLAVARPWWSRLRLSPSALDLVGVTPSDPPVRMLESREAHVAGRIGLCNAVAEYLSAGPAAVRLWLADVGSRTREALSGLDGWEVVPAAVADGAAVAGGAAVPNGGELAGSGTFGGAAAVPGVGVVPGGVAVPGGGVVPGGAFGDGAAIPGTPGAPEGCAITALRPTRGQDVPAITRRLLSVYRIPATAAHPARAPRDMDGYLLRISPHVDCTDSDLARLREALAEIRAEATEES